MKREQGFFDEEFRLREISLHGDPLEKLDSIINWDIFRISLEDVFKNEAK